MSLGKGSPSTSAVQPSCRWAGAAGGQGRGDPWQGRVPLFIQCLAWGEGWDEPRSGLQYKITLPIPGGTLHQQWMINNGDISIDTGMIMKSYPSFAKITCRIKYL